MPACAPVESRLLLVLVAVVSVAAAALLEDFVADVDVEVAVACELVVGLAVCAVLFGLDEEEDGLMASLALAVFVAVSADFAFECRHGLMPFRSLGDTTDRGRFRGKSGQG